MVYYRIFDYYFLEGNHIFLQLHEHRRNTDKNGKDYSTLDLLRERCNTLEKRNLNYVKQVVKEVSKYLPVSDIPELVAEFLVGYPVY